MYQKIIEVLNQNNINYELFDHPPVRTSSEAAAARGINLNQGGVKSMVVKVAPERFVLLMLPSDKKLDWKKVKVYFNSKSVRFATEEEAENITKVKMGSVNPFGFLVDLDVFSDPSVAQLDDIYLNPGTVTTTLKMKAKDMLSLVKPEFFDLSA